MVTRQARQNSSSIRTGSAGQASSTCTPTSYTTASHYRPLAMEAEDQHWQRTPAGGSKPPKRGDSPIDLGVIAFEDTELELLFAIVQNARSSLRGDPDYEDFSSRLAHLARRLSGA
jgi:hypothetical protein